MDDGAFAFAKAIHRRVESLIRRSSVSIFRANMESCTKHGQIFVVEGPPIESVGSGTLFQIGDERFVVTAAHVADDFRDAGGQLRIAMGCPERPQPIAASDVDIATDPVADVAVIRLQSDVVRQLQQKRFLHLDSVELDVDIADWRCVLFGYLAEGTQPNRDFSELLLHNFTYWACRHEGIESLQNYDRGTHVLLSYTQLGPTMPSGDVRANPQKLNGLSGASLWRVFNPNNVCNNSLNEPPKVIGVENAVYKDRIIRCTRWRFVLPLFLELVPSIEPLVRRAASRSGGV